MTSTLLSALSGTDVCFVIALQLPFPLVGLRLWLRVNLFNTLLLANDIFFFSILLFAKLPFGAPQLFNYSQKLN